MASDSHAQAQPSIGAPVLEFNSGRCWRDGVPAALELRLRNPHAATLVVSSVSVTGGSYLDVLARPKPLQLAPGGAAAVYLQILPRSAGRLVLDVVLVAGSDDNALAYCGQLLLDVAPADLTHPAAGVVG